MGRITRLGMISYWLLLVPAVAGGVLLRRRQVAIYPLLAFVATAAIAVAPTIGDVRYRAAAEVPLVLLAAVGIDAVLPRRSRDPREHQRRTSASGRERPHPRSPPRNVGRRPLGGTRSQGQ